MFYVNPQYYGYSAVCKALLKDTRLYCDYESFFNCVNQDGNAVLAKFDFESVNPHEHMLVSGTRDETSNHVLECACSEKKKA